MNAVIESSLVESQKLAELLKKLHAIAPQIDKISYDRPISNFNSITYATPQRDGTRITR